MSVCACVRVCVSVCVRVCVPTRIHAYIRALKRLNLILNQLNKFQTVQYCICACKSNPKPIE
jgi:hypothetical protein